MKNKFVITVLVLAGVFVIVQIIHRYVSTVQINNILNNEIFRYFAKTLITILLALFAGGLALFQMKANIISSARIKWIEDLRDNLSKLYPVVLTVPHLYKLHDEYMKLGDKAIALKHYDEYLKLMTEFNSLSNKIRMLLNSKESNHEKIEKTLEKIDNLFDPERGDVKTINMSDLETDLRVIVAASKLIFKEEWRKSKKIFKI